MPTVKFMGPTDPLFLSTLDRILEKLTFDSLVYRYELSQGASDGLAGREGTFSLCSFWLVESLTEAGRLEARLKLEKMFSYSNRSWSSTPKKSVHQDKCWVTIPRLLLI